MTEPSGDRPYQADLGAERSAVEHYHEHLGRLEAWADELVARRDAPDA